MGTPGSAALDPDVVLRSALAPGGAGDEDAAGPDQQQLHFVLAEGLVLDGKSSGSSAMSSHPLPRSICCTESPLK
jgi:hypothetical protein